MNKRGRSINYIYNFQNNFGIKKKVISIFFVFFFLIIFSFNFISASNVGLIENSTWQSNLTGVRFSTTAFGDIDNDGDLDLVLTGCLGGAGANRCTVGTIAKIYINNGSTITESSQWQNNLTGVGWSSSTFGDIDNDGDLDLVLNGCTQADDDAGSCTGNILSKIYLNNGTSFTESSQWQSNLAGVFDGSLALGDLDNDGDLDLVLNGRPTGSHITKVYVNNGSTLTESSQWQGNLTAIYEGQLALGDVNNDGKLDLALTGEKGSATDYTNFYLNNGTSFLESTQWNTNLINMDRSSIVFHNYNNDNYLDMMICGHTNGDECKIYKNNGSTFSINQSETDNPAMPGLYRASFAFGDYDNDGDLDFFAMGHENGRTKTYENDGANNYLFQNDALAHANISNDIIQGAATWADLDNDTDLDLIITSIDAISGLISSKIYINNNTIANTKPNPPTINFASSYSDGIFNLSWGNGSDSETNTSGLYYNLMIGNTTKNNTIVSGVFGGSSGGGGGSGGGANGYFGNMMQRKNLSLNKYLNNDTYTWYVQTIDTGLQKSNWSAVQSIVIGGDTTAPVISSVSSSVTSSTATVTWTTGETSNSTVLYGTTISLGSRSSSSSLVASHSISLSSLSASTLYYYNVSSCDNWNNCNTSIRYNFTTSAAGGDGGGGGGGGGSGGGGSSKIITPTPEPEKKLFDIDFSSVSCGIFEAEQGDIKTFTFNGEIIHEIAISEIISPSARLIFRPESLGLLIKTQEIKQIDLNKDNINDLQIKLFSIINKKASFSLCKLAGADILSQEEIEEAIRKEALFDVKIAIVNLFEIVRSGREVIANIEAINVNHIGQVDVIVDYYITSKKDNMTKLAQGSDTLAVEAVTSFVRSLKVPYNTKSGNYLFNVDITYKDFMTSSNAEFRVIRNYEIIIGIGVIVFIVVVIFFYLWILKRKENKLEGQIKIMKKSMGNKILIIRKKKKGDKKWQK